MFVHPPIGASLIGSGLFGATLTVVTYAASPASFGAADLPSALAMCLGIAALGALRLQGAGFEETETSK